MKNNAGKFMYALHNIPKCIQKCFSKTTHGILPLVCWLYCVYFMNLRSVRPVAIIPLDFQNLWTITSRDNLSKRTYFILNTFFTMAVAVTTTICKKQENCQMHLEIDNILLSLLATRSDSCCCNNAFIELFWDWFS